MPTFQQLFSNSNGTFNTDLSEIDYIHSSFTFPEKLFIMLEREDISCLQWVENGLCFRILDEDVLLNDVIPKYFKQTKMTSFQRQLNSYGFRKITRGSEFGCYFHPKFRRHHPQLLTQLQRLPRKGSLESYEEVKMSAVKSKPSFEVDPRFRKQEGKPASINLPKIQTTPCIRKENNPNHTIDNLDFLEEFLENFLEDSSMTSLSYGEDRDHLSYSSQSPSSSQSLVNSYSSDISASTSLATSVHSSEALPGEISVAPLSKRSYVGPYLFLGCNSRPSFVAPHDYNQYQQFEQNCMSRLLQEFYYPRLSQAAMIPSALCVDPSTAPTPPYC